MLLTPGACWRAYIFHTPGTLRTIQCEESLPVHQWRAGSSLQLGFFGHLACTTPAGDHHHVVAAALRPRAEWRRPVGRPRTTWLRTIDDDLQSLNFGVHTAWRKARDRDVWHQVVSTAMNAPPWSLPIKKRKLKKSKQSQYLQNNQVFNCCLIN